MEKQDLFKKKGERWGGGKIFLPLNPACKQVILEQAGVGYFESNISFIQKQGWRGWWRGPRLGRLLMLNQIDYLVILKVTFLLVVIQGSVLC